MSDSDATNKKLDFSFIKPLLEAEIVTVNETEIIRVGDTPLTMKEVMVAALIGRLNVFLVGEAGSGKTQLLNDVMNVYFNGRGLDLRGSLDLDLKGLLTRMNLEKLYSGKGTTRDVEELSEQVGFLLALIDELNRCPPVIQNQFFNITDGYIEFQGRKVYLGAQEDGIPYFVGLASGNMGDGVYTGTFAMDHALRDRLHLTLDTDFYFPTDEDVLDILTADVQPRIKIADKSDKSEMIRNAYKMLSANKEGLHQIAHDHFDAWLAAWYLVSGLDYINVAASIPASKRKLKNVYPDILVEKGSGSATDVLSYVKPFSIRGAEKTLSFAMALAAVVQAKTNGEYTLGWKEVLAAFELIVPYSGAIIPALYDKKEELYKHSCLAGQAVAEEVKKEFESQVTKFDELSAIAIEGKLTDTDLTGLKDNWAFARRLLQRTNAVQIDKITRGRTLTGVGNV